MSKVAVGLIITGIILLLPNLILTFTGVPSETDLGKLIINSVSESLDNPEAESIAQNTTSALNILSFASWFIPILLIIIGIILLFR